MNSKYLSLILGLMLVVSISGCVGLPSFSSLFGGTGPTIEQPADIITTEGIRVIPKPPVLSGNDFTLIFTLKNQDTIQPVENVVVRLYNWGVCAPKLETFLPTGWIKDGNTYTNTFTELGPLEEQVIELNFVAPDNSKIGNMEADCPIKWEVNYDFTAVSQDDFNVISKTRQREFDVTNTAWEGTDQAQYVGIGPIKVYFSFKTPMPVQSKSTIQFSLQVEDKGTGLYSTVASPLDGATLDPYSAVPPTVSCPTCGLWIKVPYEWVEGRTYDEVKDACTKSFVLDFDDTTATPNEDKVIMPLGSEPVSGNVNVERLVIKKDGYVQYFNIKPINLYDRMSSETICNFKAPDLDTAQIPEKSYFVSAGINNYNYKIPNEQTVHIKPSV